MEGTRGGGGAPARGKEPEKAEVGGREGLKSRGRGLTHRGGPHRAEESDGWGFGDWA